jgi:uncharacterized membrane protein
MKAILKISAQVLITALITVGLVCLMVYFINTWKFDVIVSSLFGGFTGVIIVTTGFVIHILFNER